MTTCKIQWIDQNGEPTPDTNEAVGTVYVEAHVVQIGGHGVTMGRSADYPICAEHLKRFHVEHLQAEHWVFVPKEDQ